MERLYWTRPDLVEIEVEVRVVGDSQVAIDPIVFHPDEGGQPADRGMIGGAKVLDVRCVDTRIVHTVDRPLAEGRHLACLDTRRRAYTATHHTAQHIISGIGLSRFELETVGVHIGLEACTVDFGRGVTWQTAQQIEREAMKVVIADIEVETVFDDTDVRSRFGPDRIDAELIRVVKIGDVDKSICCGAHVGRTGRIGVIRIVDMENRKGGTRLSFLAGQRALGHSQFETSVLRNLRKTASCSTAQLEDAFATILGRCKELTGDLKQLWAAKLDDLAASAEVIRFESRRVGVYVGDIPADLVAKLASLIAQSIGGAGVVVSTRRIAISSDSLDASSLFGKIQAAVGAKGGGSPRAANGRLDKDLTQDDLVGILADGQNE